VSVDPGFELRMSREEGDSERFRRQSEGLIESMLEDARSDFAKVKSALVATDPYSSLYSCHVDSTMSLEDRLDKLIF
jgi:hypothetical protein